MVITVCFQEILPGGVFRVNWKHASHQAMTLSQTQWGLEQSYGNDTRETWSDGGDSTEIDSMGLGRLSDKGNKREDGIKDNSNFKFECFVGQ